jgi:FkbM family methyltransferase
MADAQQFRQLHFSLKDRLVSLISDRLFGNFTYTVRHGLIKGMKRKGGLGFLPEVFSRSAPQDPEAAFLQSLDFRGKVVYDIGAFQGILTLFFARRAATVVAYEPQPGSYQRALENVRLNGLHNVVLVNRAVGNQETVMSLVCDPRMLGAATGDPGIGTQIKNSLPDAVTLVVPVVCLDQDIERSGLPVPDFVKIDIEGMELCALEGMRKTLAQFRPYLYLEMHGATEDEKERKVYEIARFLNAMGYGNLRHIETGATVNSSNSRIARQGHLYCSARW